MTKTLLFIFISVFSLNLFAQNTGGGKGGVPGPTQPLPLTDEEIGISQISELVGDFTDITRQNWKEKFGHDQKKSEFSLSDLSHFYIYMSVREISDPAQCNCGQGHWMMKNGVDNFLALILQSPPQYLRKYLTEVEKVDEEAVPEMIKYLQDLNKGVQAIPIVPEDQQATEKAQKKK